MKSSGKELIALVQFTKRNVRNIAVICAAAVLMLIGSTMAYFTSFDETTNRLTSWGSLDILLTETNWDPGSGVDALPGDTLPKNPKITNQGVAAYVFLRVTVPCGSPVIEYETGEHAGGMEYAADNTAPIPLYKFVANGSAALPATTVQAVYSNCWTLLEHYPILQNGCYVYVYAYTDTAGNLRSLDRGESTEQPLFDAVKLCNYNETFAETDGSIWVEALGIQRDNLDLAVQSPETIWALLGSRG